MESYWNYVEELFDVDVIAMFSQFVDLLEQETAI